MNNLYKLPPELEYMRTEGNAQEENRRMLAEKELKREALLRELDKNAANDSFSDNDSVDPMQYNLDLEYGDVAPINYNENAQDLTNTDMYNEMVDEDLLLQEILNQKRAREEFNPYKY